MGVSCSKLPRIGKIALQRRVLDTIAFSSGLLSDYFFATSARGKSAPAVHDVFCTVPMCKKLDVLDTVEQDFAPMGGRSKIVRDGAPEHLSQVIDPKRFPEGFGTMLSVPG